MNFKFTPNSSLRYLAIAGLLSAFSVPALAANQIYNFDCAPIAGDGRNTNTVTLAAGDTATINVDVATGNKCNTAYTTGNVTPTVTGVAAQAVYTVGSAGTGTIHVYKAGVGGYQWTFNHAAAPVPEVVAPVPTLSEWALFILVFCLGLSGLNRVRRQKS